MLSQLVFNSSSFHSIYISHPTLFFLSSRRTCHFPHHIPRPVNFTRFTSSITVQDWLPVGIRSWTPVYIEWSRSSRAGLNFHAAYKFVNDTYCGDHTTAEPEGEVNGGDLASAGLKLNQYYQQKCTWILDSSIDRQLVIEVKSTQSRKHVLYVTIVLYTPTSTSCLEIYSNSYTSFIVIGINAISKWHYSDLYSNLIIQIL